jgi:hypothetical protein
MELRLLEIGDSAPTAPASVAVSLRGLCGHVRLDPDVVDRGYRFFPMAGDEVPSFLVKRLAAGGRPVAAITLIGAVDPQTGEALLDEVGTPGGVGAAIGSAAGGICSARLSVGPRSVTIEDFRTAFWQQDPEVFMMIAGEFAALAPLRQDDCELCRHENE